VTKKRWQCHLHFNRLFTFFVATMPFIITYDHCLCCGSAAVSKVLTCTDYTVSKEQFDVWKCTNCTFRFTQNVPTPDYIERYYRSEEYVSHSDTKKGLVNRLYHIVRNVTLRTKRELVKGVTGLREGSLLDIGAGTGAFAGKMLQAGWDVTALEPEEQARKLALSNGVVLQDLSELEKIEANRYDAITLWHVLEHVHELHRYLERFREILKDAGRLLIAVPNYTSYDAGVYKEQWAAYDVPRHLYHFSPKSMKILLEQKGFILEKVKPMWFDSFYVSLLSEKYRSGAFFLRPLWIGLRSNLKAISNPAKCSSVIYIAKKN
jgi:2-polyprenyl-3-methyl-5-hydroxy-6-metoxy-1,4-benzoquinol methylase